MSLPRQILPDSTYLVTRRCTQRQFLLRPSKLVNQIFLYCLALAVARTGVVVHAFVVLSNHHHAVVTDPEGRLPEFLAYLHKYVSKCINASLGRWENLWASEQTSVVRLEDDEDIIDKMVYTLTNPVAAGLVKRGSHWPGLRMFRPGLTSVHRPEVFFRPDGPMPEEVTVEIVPPTVEGATPDEVTDLVAAKTSEREAAIRKTFRREGRTFMGPRAVQRQRVDASPSTWTPRRRLSPRVAAKNKWRRIEALRRVKAFLVAYRAAYLRWKAGALDAIFPTGTYALRGHPAVVCADP